MSDPVSRDPYGTFVDSLHDLGHAWRVVRNRPGFALAVVLTLALGIGANTAVFGVIYAVVLSPLPYEESDGLYTPLEQHTSGRQRGLSYPTFQDWQQQADVFEGLAYARGAPVVYQTQEHSGLLLAAFVTDDFFELLAVEAEMGRALSEDDYQAGAPGALVLSRRAWRRWFGSDTNLIGQTITVDDIPLTVVGIMPAFFAYPDWGADNDLWIPLNQMPPSELAALNQRGFYADSRVIARPREDLSHDVVQARIDALAVISAATYPETSAGWTGASLESVKEREVRSVRPRLLMLWGAVGMVLLICCLNLANLYLVHGTSRRHEYAVRRTLGAGHARLFRQALAEASFLSVLGGFLGVLLALFGTAWARNGVLAGLPRISELTFNGAVMVFAAVLSMGAALAFALIAARPLVRVSLQSTLSRGGARASSAPGILSWIQSAQMGVTFVLLVGAGLLGQSFLKLSRIDPGYDPAGLVLVPVNPPSPTYDDAGAAVALYGALREAVEDVPGVSAVGLTNHGPGGTAGAPTAASIGGIPQDSDEDLSVFYRTVSDGYFRAAGIRLMSGREFGLEDLAGGEGPVIVNETLAGRWGGASPIGEVIGVRKAASSRDDFGQPLMGRVVGVVADLDPSETGGSTRPIIYVPFTHSPWAQVRLLIRTADTSTEMLRRIETAVWDVDPAIPLSGPFISVRRMEEIRSAQRADERLNAGLVGVFTLVALLLASVGMYGVVSYSVALRTRALAIRMAVGASPTRVTAGVVREVAQMAFGGLAAGAVAGLFLTRFVASLLFEVTPLEPATYALAAAFLLATALAAGYAPARRAGRLDPAVSLRAE